VTINEDNNQTHPVLSIHDYTPEEHFATYYSKYEYHLMRQNIKRTINYLKCREGPSTPAAHGDFLLEDDVCVRGLECLADAYVALHRKRVRQVSMSAVFVQQDLQRQRQQQFHQEQQQQQLRYPGAPMVHITTHQNQPWDDESIAQVYKSYSTRCQGIACRWGHFDAMDAGIITEH
jgi:hypothetical protein